MDGFSQDMKVRISNHVSSAETKYNLKNATSFGAFLKQNQANMLEPDLAEYLMALLRQKGLKRSQVVEHSGVDKAYVYQIFNGDKRPSRDKLIAITFGMGLNEEETQRVLKMAGHSELYPRLARDALILFYIQRGKDIWETDDALDKNGFATLLSAD